MSKIYKQIMKHSIKRKQSNKKWVEGLNRHFSKDILMVNKYMKRCSTSLIIREIQIKITIRYHLTLVRMAIIRKKSINKKCWKECGEKGNNLHCWWECKLIQLLWRTVWRFLKKLKLELTRILWYRACILLEKAMGTHSSTLAWRIQGTAEPGRLLSTGSHKVGHE